MRKLYFLVIPLLFVYSTKAQVASYDALVLKELLSVNGSSAEFPDDDESLAAVCAVLVNYYPELKGKTIDEVITAITTKNGPYKDKYYNMYLDQFFSDTLRQSEARKKAFVDSAATGILGMDVSVVARGVAEFLVKRASQELFISIIEKLNKAEKYPEIPLLFPNTKLLLESFSSWQYSNITNTLRAALEKDMQNIMANLPKLATLDPDDYEDKEVKARVSAIKKFFNYPDAPIYISALAVGDGLIKSKKIPDILQTIATERYLTGMAGASAEFKNTIRLIDVLSYSLRSNQMGRNYISKQEFNAILNDVNTLKLYQGLLYAKMKSSGITFSNTELSEIIGQLQRYLEQLITTGEQLDRSLQALQEAKQKGEKDLSSNWALLFDAANRTFATLASVTTITPKLSIPPQLQLVVSYSVKATEIANDIAMDNYSAVIVDVIGMIPDNIESEDFRKFFVKYGSFAANVIQATNAEEFSNALESFALPVGSYTIKQRSSFTVSLNGYVGYALDLNGGLSHGIYAPVGFSGSWGLQGAKKNWGALTLFAGVIDVGNIIAYNVDNEEVDDLKHEIRLESIFSPSFQLLYQFPGTPITLGAGWRRTPKLFYENDSEDIVVQPKNALNISILIDIPLITLYNKSLNRL